MNLTARIFLGTALVVTAVLGGTLVVADRSATAAADETIGRALHSTMAQARQGLQARQQNLLAQAGVFARNSSFYAIIVKKDPSSALDQATEAVQATGATWVQFTDDQGVRLARSDDPSAPQDTLSGSALIGGALEGRAVTGYAVVKDDALAQVIAIPIVQGDTNARIIGTMMAAQVIDSAYVQQLRETAGDADLVFFSYTREGKPHLVASTLGRTAAVQAALAAPTLTPDSSGAMKATTLRLGDETYVGQGEIVRLADGSPAGGYLTLRSRDAAFATFRELRRTLLLGGGLGLVVAFLLSFAVARGITRPVSALAQAAKRAAEGDYVSEITGTGTDEIGRLAGAFRALLSDLRDKQELVELLQAEEARRTVPIDAMGATLQLAARGPGGILPGQRFARRYDVKEILGAGGMGTVFKAVDSELGEVVAIKTLKADFAAQDPKALDRFRSEIRLARKISHRNVVRTHDIGEADGIYYITMEYAEGRSLHELIRQRGRLPAGAVVTIGRQLCRALEVAHEAGVIHRDIKPQNIILGNDGVLKVMDFGIARLAERPAAGITQAGMIVGTPAYMAPEQLLGDDVDARVDIYAAGAVLYQCLTGMVPHTADSPITLITKVLEEDPRPVRELAPEVPPALEEAVMAALRRNRDERPATATALHERLAVVGGEAAVRESGATRRFALTPPRGV